MAEIRRILPEFPPPSRPFTPPAVSVQYRSLPAVVEPTTRNDQMRVVAEKVALTATITFVGYILYGWELASGFALGGTTSILRTLYFKE